MVRLCGASPQASSRWTPCRPFPTPNINPHDSTANRRLKVQPKIIVQISKCKAHNPNCKVEDQPRTAYEENEIAIEYGSMRNRHQMGEDGVHVESRHDEVPREDDEMRLKFATEEKYEKNGWEHA